MTNLHIRVIFSTFLCEPYCLCNSILCVLIYQMRISQAFPISSSPFTSTSITWRGRRTPARPRRSREAAVASTSSTWGPALSQAVTARPLLSQLSAVSLPRYSMGRNTSHTSMSLLVGYANCWSFSVLAQKYVTELFIHLPYLINITFAFKNVLKGQIFYYILKLLQ